MKHYKLWHLELHIGWETVYSGKYKLGLGFNVTARVIEIKWKWRRLYKKITDIKIEQ